jgi:hypothetical protein
MMGFHAMRIDEVNAKPSTVRRMEIAACRKIRLIRDSSGENKAGGRKESTWIPLSRV